MLRSAGFSEAGCPFKEHLPIWEILNSKYIPYSTPMIMDAYLENINGHYVLTEKNKYYKYLLISYPLIDPTQGTRSTPTLQSIVYAETANSLKLESYNSYNMCIAIDEGILFDQCNQFYRPCFWKNDLTFCDAYNKICSSDIDNPNCFCQSKYTEGFFCR